MQHQKALRSAPATPGPVASAAVRRERARQQHLQQLDGCPGHLVLGLLSERWATLIVEALVDGPRRHADLHRQVPGATQKMLTQTLRSLRRNGLVSRSVQPASPVRVEYQLTDLGQELWRLQRVVHSWAVEHAATIRAAQADFDMRAATSPEPSVVELNRREPPRPSLSGRAPSALRR